MRKVKLQMQVSVDGFVAGLNGEQDWMIWDWDDTLNQYVAKLTESVDSMLIGRATYQGMAGYWPAAANDPAAKKADLDFAHKMNSISKLVFSKTLDKVEWNNSKLAKGTITEEVQRLKQEPGKDIIIYGGAGIVSSFIQHDLIDEYHLFVNPVILGSGMSIFRGLENKRKLKLIRSVSSSVGIVILCFSPVRG